MAVEHHYPLVTAQPPAVPIPQSLLDSVEPAFPVADSTDLVFPAEYQAGLADYFCHCVARDPNDLRSHVRRILLEREQGDSHRLYAALVDLFLALGKRGTHLRQRMTEQAKPNLQPTHYLTLRSAYTEALASVIAVPGSVLCRGIEGHPHLALAAGEKLANTRDPLQEAREYMEYSQVDEARELLERAALAESHRIELLLELLDIYRSTRDEANFTKMSLQLADAGIEVPDEWLALADHFGGHDAV